MAWLKLSPEVEQALKNARPVVALESTIISHGMPYPQNLKTAQEVEAVLRGKGVVPATIGILKGVVHVGMDAEQLEALARRGLACRKVSRRDIAQVLAQKQDGATTVSATMIFAHQAGISIFVTGGIGGVHRGDASDVSADLTELGRTPMCVVCAGAKSILDLPRTLEFLETQGVCVCGYGTDDFPAFFTPTSGLPTSCRVDSPSQAAELLQKQLQVQLNSGMVLAVPVPEHLSAEGKAVEEATRTAVEESVKQNIKGNEVTPFLLKRINELTQGESLRANIALVKHNAEVGALMAVELAKLGRAFGHPTLRQVDSETMGAPCELTGSVAEVHVLRFVSISTLTTSSAQSLEGAEESEKPPVPSTSSTPNVNAVEQNVSSTQLAAESQSSSSWNGSDGLAGDTAYVVPFHFSCARRMTCPKPWEVQHRSSWLIVLLCRDDLNGTFLMQKTRSCDARRSSPDEKSKFTKDPNYEQLVRRSFGPDQFEFLLEGAELLNLNLNMSYRCMAAGKACCYALPFRANVPGRYHLNLAWLREGFTGVSERLRGWQPMNYRSPLDQSFIELGNSSATRDILQSWQRGDHLPRCNVTSEQYEYLCGRWLFGAVSETNTIFPWGSEGQRLPMEFTYPIRKWTNSSRYRWAPNSCHLSFISPEEGAKCLTGKRILLVGDSHLRQLTRAVIEAVCGSSLDIPKRVSKCLLPDMGRCKNVQEICFLADDYLRGTLRDLANYDLIVAGYSHWHVAYNFWPLSKYIGHLKAFSKQLKAQLVQNPSLRVRFAWHQATAICVKDHSRLGDARSTPKMQIHSLAAHKIFKELGVPIIDSFQQTASLTRSGEGIHFSSDTLMRSSLQFLLHLLC
ncbi:unnamed protein product [Durusdinium trenchii]|uniref:Carbohydrate kinase PfkB domain-containing protein n=1 Tax=Durusdinium trenchii TaxID=1381693 RepID=A0ABP0MFB7_9DINO